MVTLYGRAISNYYNKIKLALMAKLEAVCGCSLLVNLSEDVIKSVITSAIPIGMLSSRQG
jgi:hypothetical protein